MRARNWIAVGLTALLVIAGCTSEKSNRPASETASSGRGPHRQVGLVKDYDIQIAQQAVIADPIPGFEHFTARSGITASIDLPRKSNPQPRAAAPGDEELWVIERDAPPAADGPVQVQDDTPGSGSLIARGDSVEKEIPCPLEHTHVQARITGYIGTIEVTQRFKNPFAEKIEAVYVFPLSHDSAVNEFVMTVGDRRIRGIIREREEAKRIYEEARSQGYVASLLTQERPNIFTQKVANIEPGKSIDVNITYIETMTWANGGYEFSFPMVVGPRFNPPGTTDGVGAVPRREDRTSGQATEVSYLRPGERTGHDIMLAVDLEAGVEIEDMETPSHAVHVERVSPTRAAIVLDRKDTIPNKDFVLRWKVAGGAIKTALFTHRDQRGGYFTLMLFPPKSLLDLPRQPMELVFVLDCSGSMSGEPLAKAKTAIRHAIEKLGPDDTFQIIRFSEDASALGPKPIAATPENVRKGLAFLQSLSSEGGTMMIEGIKAALDFPHDPRRLRVVSFMTDGHIGNEQEIFTETARRLGDARLFSFGVGSSVNRYLLDGLARMGRGAVAYVGLHEEAGRAVDGFYEAISHPALTDVRVDWGGMGATEVFPARAQDLLVGRPVVLTGRFTGTGKATIRLTGMAGGERHETALDVDLDDAGATHAGIASIWARMEIKDLAFRASAGEDDGAAERIKAVALEYGLMSAYTAFVAVDSLTRTEGDHGTTVTVPVPMPEGVRYETTVPGGSKRDRGEEERPR